MMSDGPIGVHDQRTASAAGWGAFLPNAFPKWASECLVRTPDSDGGRDQSMSTDDQNRNARVVGDGGKPIAPAIIPEYVRKGVERQDATILRQIATWCEELAEYREERPIEVDDDEELVEVKDDDGGDDGSGGTTVIN